MSDTAFDVRSADGLRLAGHEIGRRGDPTVLFLHGGGQTRFAWDATMRSIAAAGWRAVAMDLRGHGESDRAPDGDYRLDALAADIASYVAG
jgi:pimeloyl-ACP methyl ester carboxylesterase